jgi:hypothetical protein
MTAPSVATFTTAGGQNEERTADRISQQTEELEQLIKDRDALQEK